MPSTLDTRSRPTPTAGAPRTLPRPVPLHRTIWQVAEARWATAATALFAIGGIVHLAGGPTWLFWTLYLACYAAGGWEPALAGLQALRERTLDVDVLMIVAALAAAAIGQVFDGALLIVIFATSGALEAIATRRTQDSVRALLHLAPERAVRVLADGGEEQVDTADLVPGDLVLVRPGNRIGADGAVVDGASDVDQASITGEPLPVAKQVGAEVFAGTVNGAGVLTVRVERAAADSVVARIVTMVEEASETKARTQLFIEKVEQRYSVVVVVATLLLLGVPLLLGAAFEPTLLRAMTFMIVASPCAIVLATMPPLLAVMANAGRHGVLLKSAVALERLAQVDRVAFDKTGTLTLGTPEVVDVALLPDAGAAGLTEDGVVTLAAAAERGSEHPVGRAVVRYAEGLALAVPPAHDFLATPGRGVTATVAGRVVEVASPRGAAEPAVARVVAAQEAGGRTAILVLLDGRACGVIALADRVRPDAPAAVAALDTLTGSSPVLLTGDNRAAADALATRVGIGEVRAGLLPEHKVDAVRSLQAAGHRVALVGDGINDAPAMATAHVGIAMGRTGSDLATETSDAVLVRDDLTALPRAIALSRRAERVVKANLVFASAVIVVLVTWDVVGTLPLPIGVAGHEGSTVVVALNGLRLLRAKAWRDAV